MGKISKGIVRTFFSPEHFSDNERPLFIIFDLIIVLSFIMSILFGIIMLFNLNNSETRADMAICIKWTLIILFSSYFMSVLYDIKHFPFKLIKDKLLHRINYVEDFDFKLKNMIIQNPNLKVSYIIDYLPKYNMYYPIFIINGNKYICVKGWHPVLFGIPQDKLNILCLREETYAIKCAKDIYAYANKQALEYLDKQRLNMVSKQNKQTQSLNILLDLKAKYSKPVTIN